MDSFANKVEEVLVDDGRTQVDDPLTWQLYNLPPFRGHECVHIVIVLEEVQDTINRKRFVLWYTEVADRVNMDD